MTRYTAPENIYDIANAERLTGARYVVGTWTVDDQDRTYQSSATSDSPVSTLDDAQQTMSLLKEKVVMAGLPTQWLLDVTIQISVYDYQTCEYTTDTFAIVYVPSVAPNGEPDGWINNGRAMGLQIVRISSRKAKDSQSDSLARKEGDQCPTSKYGHIEHDLKGPHTCILNG